MENAEVEKIRHLANRKPPFSSMSQKLKIVFNFFPIKKKEFLNIIKVKFLLQVEPLEWEPSPLHSAHLHDYKEKIMISF